MRTEEIERYLTRQMAGEEREAFEREMQEQPQLREDVKIVAWTIEAIRKRGLQEDAESIRRMREQMGSDSKRYKATVAAVIGGVLVVAAMTAVSIPPIYNNVIKPVIESVFGGKENTGQGTTQQSSSTAPMDSVASIANADSIDMDSLAAEEDNALPEEPQQSDETKAEEEKPLQQTVNEEPTKEEPSKPAVEEEKKEPENNTIDKQINITGQNWMDENGTKYNPYSLTCHKGELILHVSLVNNNEDRDIEITDVRLLDESGNMHNPTKVTINSKSNKYHLRRTEKAELEIHFSLGTSPKRIQSISIHDNNSSKKGVIKNIFIN